MNRVTEGQNDFKTVDPNFKVDEDSYSSIEGNDNKIQSKNLIVNEALNNEPSFKDNVNTDRNSQSKIEKLN